MRKDIVMRYINYMISGNWQEARKLFFSKPQINVPGYGKIFGDAAFMKFISQRSEWMNSGTIQIEHVATTATDKRIVEEFLVGFNQIDEKHELPLAAVADLNEGKLDTLRIYYSLWPLQKKHEIREPILKKTKDLSFPLVVQSYQQGLKQSDLETILAQFAENAYVREPAGRKFKGSEQIKQFYEVLFSNGGGVVLDYCSVTDDGEHCAIEYNVVRWGQDKLPSQAGIAVYGYKDNLITAIRIYDDVNAPSDRGNFTTPVKL